MSHEDQEMYMVAYVLPIHAEMRAVAAKAGLSYPVSYLTEGFVAGLLMAFLFRGMSPPPTTARRNDCHRMPSSSTRSPGQTGTAAM